VPVEFPAKRVYLEILEIRYPLVKKPSRQSGASPADTPPGGFFEGRGARPTSRVKPSARHIKPRRALVQQKGSCRGDYEDFSR